MQSRVAGRRAHRPRFPRSGWWQQKTLRSRPVAGRADAGRGRARAPPAAQAQPAMPPGTRSTNPSMRQIDCTAIGLPSRFAAAALHVQDAPRSASRVAGAWCRKAGVAPSSVSVNASAGRLQIRVPSAARPHQPDSPMTALAAAARPGSGTCARRALAQACSAVARSPVRRLAVARPVQASRTSCRPATPAKSWGGAGCIAIAQPNERHGQHQILVGWRQTMGTLQQGARFLDPAAGCQRLGFLPGAAAEHAASAAPDRRFRLPCLPGEACGQRASA